MKTIFISSFHSLISRNILYPILDNLVSNDIKVVIFVPNYKKDFFIENFHGNNIIIEGINTGIVYKSLFNKLFHKVFFVLQNTININIRLKEEFLKDKNYIKYFFKKRFKRYFSNFKFLINILRKLDFIFSNKKIFNNYFDIYKPDLVFSTDIFLDEDVTLMREAIKRNIFTMGMVRSWDNAISKGICRIIPNKIVVHNEIISGEMEEIHKIEKDRIFISGIPHCDFLFNFKPISRESFFKQLPLDSKKRLILFSPAGEKFTNIDEQIITILKDAINNKKFVDDVQFLIRCHPTNYISQDKIFSSDDFVVERPGVAIKGGDYKRRELGWDDYIHLADSLYHSDVIINVLSTIGIEAAIFNKPQIIIGFDGYEKRDYYSSIKRFHDDDHMSKFLKTGVAKIAKSPKELIDFINIYLSNPNLDESARKIAVKEQCWDIKGESVNKLVNYLKGFLN